MDKGKRGKPMTIIKCKMCGGDVALSPDKSMGICEYCGAKQEVVDGGR